MQLSPPLASGIVERPTADGQLLFGDNSSGKWFKTETSEIVWDDTNKRLGIGVASPNIQLHIKGSDTFNGFIVEKDGGSFCNLSAANNSVLAVKAGTSLAFGHKTNPTDAAWSNNEFFVIADNDYVGVGLPTTGTSPGRRFEVLDATNPQIRGSHTAGTHYFELQANGSGYLKLITSGGGYGIDVAPTAVQTGYTTPSNLTTDRTFDADSTTVAGLADVLGTLIEDLKAKGIISA